MAKAEAYKGVFLDKNTSVAFIQVLFFIMELQTNNTLPSIPNHKVTIHQQYTESKEKGISPLSKKADPKTGSALNQPCSDASHVS